jgi:hypothetical protein
LSATFGRSRLSETPQPTFAEPRTFHSADGGQLIHFPVRAEMEVHQEAQKLIDDEGSALVGMEFVSWLAPKRQRELSIVVLPDNS